MSSPQPRVAGATRQPAEFISRAFSSSYSNTTESMVVGTGSLRHRAKIPPIIKDMVAAHKESLRSMEAKEEEIIRPILDELHAQVIVIQDEIKLRWRDYETRIAKARNYTEQRIARLQQQIRDPEQETSNYRSSLAPIHRIPTELLAEIFGIVIGCYEDNPFAVMRVCRSWHATVLSMAHVWSQFTVRPWTSHEQIEFLVERTKRVPLDVVVDLNARRNSFRHARETMGDYRGLDLAVTTMPRWRKLIVAAFPNEPDISAASEGEGRFPVTFYRPLGQLEAFKITGICETSAPFNRLLDTVATTSTERLSYVEITTPNALYHLASPKYHSLFSRLRHFKVDVREMKDPADILPCFENLEVLEAYRLHLPTYGHDVDLPIVHTLKRMSIKAVSMQWMYGRTFTSLEDCTIIWPHHPETICPRDGIDLRGGIDLPVCTQFTYASRLTQPLSEFRLPKLDNMVVRNEAWNGRRGSAQLASVWGESMNPRWLRPRILHLDTQCYDQYLIDALQLHPDLEELVLGLVGPGGLGKKFFNNMVARRLKGPSSLSASPSGPARPNVASGSFLVAPLLPKLKVFGVRYRRWIREGEKDEVKPMLEKIIQSREKTEVSLQSVKFWPTKDTPEAGAEELVPSRR